MNRPPNYDKFPCVNVPMTPDVCASGKAPVIDALKTMAGSHRRISIDTYPGADDQAIIELLRSAFPNHRIAHTADLMKSPEAIRAMVEPWVTDDPVFGVLSRLRIADFFDDAKVAAFQASLDDQPLILYGVGAAAILQADLCVYADLARWEIQLRQRRGKLSNLGVENLSDGVWRKYKWAFFVDWRVADRHKRAIWQQIDLFLDMHDPKTPKLVSADAVRAGLEQCVSQPFRVVPFFDPGVWGGQWMKEFCDLPKEPVNYAWCFDCVPEENALLLRFGSIQIELPSINLVHQHPEALLGTAVYGRFGAEFPIRFDFLDTMDGGNLSLQVHPLTEYVQEHFGIHYTQDESYYMLDAKPNACVYLGFKSGVDPAEFVTALESAQKDASTPLDAERFVNKIPAKTHDHFLIPAGTIHCSGKDSMVLEISATPYIFTFKLWDWGRLDLNGQPRPINIQHGSANLQYQRDTDWTMKNLVNQTTPIASGDGWREERTGLHEAEFIETRRHWFAKPVAHDTQGGVNVLNLVQGEEAIVESPTGAFEPFTVHYAETFIIPAAVGKYVIRPVAGECATMKAFVRTNA